MVDSSAATPAESGKCLICGEPAAARPAVYCADCGSVHHRECFEYAGRCAVYACGGLRYSATGRGGRDVTVLSIGAPPTLTTRLVLDLTTPVERSVSGALWVGLFLAVVAGGLGSGGALAAALAFALAGAIARATTDCYYIVDRGTQQVLYHQRVCGRLRVHSALSFKQMGQLAIVVRSHWVPTGWRPIIPRQPRPEDVPHWEHRARLIAVGEAGEELVLSDAVRVSGWEDLPALAALVASGEHAARLVERPFRVVQRTFDPVRDGDLPRWALVGLLGLAGVALTSHPFVRTGMICAAMCGIQFSFRALINSRGHGSARRAFEVAANGVGEPTFARLYTESRPRITEGPPGAQ